MLPDGIAYDVTRRKNVTLQQFIYKRTRTQPGEGRRSSCSSWCARSWAATTTSTRTSRPTYNPWDQRLCLVPNSDLFAAIRSGKASVVTDTIDTFTETGIELASGDELDGRHHRHRHRACSS